MLLSLQGKQARALLALADGTFFYGHSIGAQGVTVGEVVFNTSMTGYQEILTDPSYCQQIVTLTYPHIGNYGVNDEDIEATQVLLYAGRAAELANEIDAKIRAALGVTAATGGAAGGSKPAADEEE